MEYMTIGLSTSFIGIAIVFAVLALLTFFLSTIKYLPFISENNKNEKQETAVKVVNTAVIAKEPEQSSYMNDIELVAVITSAIAAYMGTKTEMIAVRSIEKSHSGI